MPRSRAARLADIGRGDYRHLIQPRGEGTTWYVQIDVPTALREFVADRRRRLTASLGTTDIREARVLRPAVEARLRAELDRARHKALGIAERDDDAERAMRLREERNEAHAAGDLDRAEVIEWEITDATDTIAERERRTRGASMASGEGAEPATPRAERFAALAYGHLTPFDAYEDRWLDASSYSPRTKADARAALRELAGWLRQRGESPAVEAVDRRMAASYRDEWFVARSVHRKTANKKMSLLRQFWQWLGTVGAVDANGDNPWRSLSLRRMPANRTDPNGADGGERPFTADEMRRLFSGTPDQDLSDLMRIAALSGMRLEEIGQLRVRNVADGAFRIEQGKTLAARRLVPIHPALKPIIARRIEGKEQDHFLIEGLPNTGWGGNRTMAASKRFATYRRRIGVDDQREGARRSKVNFHSFRRWFITELEEAGVPENVAAKIAGHERGTTESFRAYSQARLDTAMREAVQKIVLPAL